VLRVEGDVIAEITTFMPDRLAEVGLPETVSPG
jgi:hypothetical protein